MIGLSANLELLFAGRLLAVASGLDRADDASLVHPAEMHGDPHRLEHRRLGLEREIGPDRSAGTSTQQSAL